MLSALPPAFLRPEQSSRLLGCRAWVWLAQHGGPEYLLGSHLALGTLLVSEQQKEDARKTLAVEVEGEAVEGGQS